MRDVKLDLKDKSTIRAGRVRVEFNLKEPLKVGQLIRIAGKVIWLDFRYERLPHFCYSCGKIGHYASYCKDIPFTEAKMEGKEKMAYGQWLRAEVKEYSPYWITFYETHDKQKDEVVPETPSSTPLIPSLPPCTDTHIAEQHLIL